MLPQAGATELILVALVALIVVGPKDLPVLMRKIGQWVGKMRGLAAEFRSSFDELARQSELDELRKEVEALRNTAYVPDPLTNVHPTFDEVSAGLDPDGFRISEQQKAAELQRAAEIDSRTYPAVGPDFGMEDIEPPAKPARAPRKPKAATAKEPTSAPAKPRRAKAAPGAVAKADAPEAATPAKRRVRRSGAAEAEG